MKDDFGKLVENFKHLKVLVLGDAILDTYVKGTPDRVCREAPVLVYNVEEQEHHCGGAANTAINIVSLGAQCYFFSVVGKDVNGKTLIDELKAQGVHTEYVLKDKSRTTIAKKRITASSNILMRIDEGTTRDISEVCQEQIIDNIIAIISTIDAIIISDYHLGVITENMIEEIKKLASTHNKIVVVDARDLQKYRQFAPTAVKPNYEETCKLLQLEKETENRVTQIQPMAAQLHELTGADKVAVTLDTEGVLFFEKGKPPHRILAAPHDNKNAIGAGDTFTSALTLSLALNANGETAAEIAAAAAAVVVKKDGTAGCTNNELKGFFHSNPKYISDNATLLSIVKEARKKGKKIVFTNGCFDIIHKGHISLLNKAREAGDVLVVGVNSDGSIRKLKGPDRPINTLEDRIAVLAGLQSVDYLVSFDEESPVQLIKSVHPDIFVKGGNYSEKTIPEAPLLKKIGCVLEIVPYKEEHTTTQLINRIRDTNNDTPLELQEQEYLKEGRLN